MEEKQLTRQEYRQQEKKAEKAQNTKERIRIRLLPIWLRLVIVCVLITICVLSGAVVGYSVIGGGEVSDVFKTSTWTHIVDLVNKDL
ncbi:DNA-directed RNA polymerase subunit beta [Peribacillus glennii]|uniref:DNA-directed RNA polymerase subunit beta n=1 Tax=Peribacillus glennii TaxID=2303991 RepID=A0A372L7P0_9BACI|nr:DNA-directed RNA polymerase subunit beta [Peribacillus glennii]RFU60731.1 DNA-directed RNA polymerase subunit beta [Peribacillus glennii]